MNLFKAPNFRKKLAVTQAKEQMHPFNRNSRTSRRHLSKKNPGQRMRRSKEKRAMLSRINHQLKAVPARVRLLSPEEERLKISNLLPQCRQ